MGRNPGWLSGKQIEVLQWVSDGCPAKHGAEGYERRITARALQRRGLITIKGHGPSWAASITDAGRARLAAASGQPNDAEVDALVRRVVAADGPVAVPDAPEAHVRFKRLVEMSNPSPARPKGWRLEIRGTGPWDGRRQQIVLVRYFEDLVEEAPVPVPGRVSAYHPAAKAYLADGNRQLVSREHVTRAAHILQAIADEAPRRGLSVLTPKQALPGADPYRGERELNRAHIVLRSPAGQYGIRITEVSAPGGKPVPPVRSDARQRRPAWFERRNTEFVGTGVLELVVEGPGTGYSGDRYRDSKTIRLEEKLPRVFRAIEIQRLYDEHRQEERRREAADRQRRWEEAMADARRQYHQQARWDHFVRQANEWQAINDRRVFLAAIRAVAAAENGSDDLSAHLDFVERSLDESDPLRHLELIVPDVPEPTPDDLKPFLDGWSPMGPEPLGW